MAAHLFSESGQMQEVDIPDIFDVLEGGEDESAVKYLLGFGDDSGGQGSSSSDVIPQNIKNIVARATARTPSETDEAEEGEIRRGPGGRLVKKRDTTGIRAIYACSSCGKAFTTKFNLRRHINLHCNKSKEAGVPKQGPPSAHFVNKKGITVEIMEEPGLSTALLPPPPITPTMTTIQLASPIAAVVPPPMVSLISPPPPPVVVVAAQTPLAPIQLPAQTVQVFQDLNNAILPSSSSSPPSSSGLVITATSAPSSLSSTSSSSSSILSPASSSSSYIPNVIVPRTNPSLPNFTVSIAVGPAAPSPPPHHQNNNSHPLSMPKTILLSSSPSLTIPSSTSVSNNNNSNGGVAHTLPADLFDNAVSPVPPFMLPMSEHHNDESTATTKCIEFIVAKIPDPPMPLPPKPPKRKVTSIPDGWVRKPVWFEREYRVLYYNRSGKKFSSQSEVAEYFSRLGRDVDVNLFDFLPTRPEVEEIREERRKEREAAAEASAAAWPISYFSKKMPTKRRLSGGEEDDEDSRDDGDSDGGVVPAGGIVVAASATTAATTSAATTAAGGDRRSATPEPGKKKKKIDPQQQMQSLYDFMRRYRREDGSELCEPFIRAPKRRTDPQYYEVVADPIDMLRIQQKLKTDEYAELDELRADFKRLFDNAFAYYKSESEEREAAEEMKDLYEKAVAKVEAGEDPSVALGTREEGEEENLPEMLEDLFASVITANDPGDPNRQIHLAFRLLPSRKRYPEYYEHITDAIDLKTIGTKIQNNDYESITDLEEDLVKLTKNAMHFNEPGSQIYKDAKNISKLVKSKKYELEANRVARENRGSRSTRRLHGKKHYSADMAELQYEDSESEESEEDEEMESDDPLWALYSYVRHYETPSGVKLYEPFLTLPSKRELPDYFVAIPDPISLNLIRKKLKAGEYANQLTELADDLNTMFENCKTYNRPDSRLYKEGAKLQKMMNQRLEELEMDDDEDDSMAGGGGGVVSTPVPVSRSPPKSTTLTSPREALKKRLRTLYNAVLRHRNREGIEIIGLFMEKPSKRDYPDYYEVILNPMDMNTIEGRIKNDVYKTEDEFMSDIKLMFTNCRKYNEEGSDIYEDANVLERVLMTKAREMGLTVSRKAGRKRSTMKPAEKIKSLFDLLRDHKDSKGRQLSLIFLRLPNPKEFPDYFEVIKNPIDFEKVNAKLKQNAYSGVEECLSDFMLMFDNASKYNEPDSQIYKDALNLQSLAGRIARNMHDADDSGIPDVQIAVQELLNYIFISMYNHRDSDERSYSDSLTEVAEHDESEGKKIRALSLDLIKRRLDRGLYKRLVVFQRDVFTVLERARNLSRSDSQVFEDAVELQVNFIKFRDDACANGDVLQSKALLYTLADLQKAVEEQKAQKVLLEQPEEAEPQQQQAEGESSSSGDTATFNQQEYRIGEFVYAENTDNKASEPFIYLIENIFTKKDGETKVYGNRFFRPIETFHVSTRKFLEKEVFRSDLHSMVSVSAIAGRCIVVPVRDYYRSKPNGFEEKDTYVCESRYTSKAKTFKKMKLFWTPPEHIKMALRDEPLEMKRVMSVFKERIEKHKEELDEIEAMVRTVEEELPPNVLWNCPDGEVLPHQVNEERTYYEQYTIPGPITLRRGDMVYVRSENGKNLIAQIDTMWTSAEDQMAYFHGPWFVTPRETPLSGQLPFYRQEALLSTISDSNPLLSVVGKCSVLEVKDYTVSRPTQYREPDCFVCESIYDESKRAVRGPLEATGLKQYEMGAAVQTDEIYFFKNPIVIQKESPASTFSLLPKASTMDIDNEDSLDAPPSVGSIEAAATPTTPSQKKVKKENERKKPATSYILFSSAIRRSVSEQNKNGTFGDISRIVGEKKPKSRPRSGYQIFSSQVWVKVKTEMTSGNFAEVSREIGNQWRQLPEQDKLIYEEKAKKVNEESNKKYAEDQRAEEERRRHDGGTPLARPPGYIQLQQQQQSHHGHPQQQVQQLIGGQQVLVSRPQLQQVAGGVVQSMNRPPSQGHPIPPVKPMEPIFHTVPPRPQRLLHSEAYIRYIEGLTADSQTMSNWERQLNSTKETTKTDEARLPAHWLADNGEHGTSIDALWALRDFMMCDSLGLSKIL